jgi:SagB-type dehydrogenase family enzyme
MSIARRFLQEGEGRFRPGDSKREAPSEAVDYPHRFVLPDPLRQMGPFARALSRETWQGGEDSRPNLRSVATLLAWTYGIVRLEANHVWPWHRPVPSVRCLYPVRLYVALPVEFGAPVPAGVYLYEARGHSLGLVRSAAVKEMLVYVGVYFPDIVAQYGGFAYRLCSQEAGMVSCHLALVARALGLSAYVRYRFADPDVNAFLGLDGIKESIFALVYLDNVTQTFMETSAPSLVRLNVASQAGVNGDRGLRLPVPLEIDDDFAAVIRARHSGCPDGLLAEPLPLPLEVLSTILWWGTKRPRTDVLPIGLISLYLVVNRVTGLAPGVYRYEPVYHHLECLQLGDFRFCLQEADRRRAEGNVNLASAPVALVLCVRYEGWLNLLGDRGYRVAHMEAGAIAQCCILAGSALGLVARPLDSFDEGMLQELIGEDGDSPVLMLPVLRERPWGRVMLEVL